MTRSHRVLEKLRQATAHAERVRQLEEELAVERRQLHALLADLSSSGGAVRYEVGATVSQHVFPNPVVVGTVPELQASARVMTWLTSPATPEPDVSVLTAAANHVHAAEAKSDSSKYEMIFDLIASGHFDIALAARVIYGDDSERSRNKVHAGIAYLRGRGDVERGSDGSWRLTRSSKGRDGLDRMP